MSAQTLELITEDARPWHEIAEEYLLRRIRTGREFSCYDLERDGCPPPADHHRWGQFFGDAARRRLIVRYDITRSSRPGSHSTLVRVWINPRSKRIR